MNTIIIETYHVPGTFQIRIKRGWDGAFYFECGADWTNHGGFWHPMPGAHHWRVERRGNNLGQCPKGVVACHYPISLSPEILAELETANA